MGVSVLSVSSLAPTHFLAPSSALLNLSATCRLTYVVRMWAGRNQSRLFATSRVGDGNFSRVAPGGKKNARDDRICVVHNVGPKKVLMAE